jgi:hypothetical protein
MDRAQGQAQVRLDARLLPSLPIMRQTHEKPCLKETNQGLLQAVCCFDWWQGKRLKWQRQTIYKD